MKITTLVSLVILGVLSLATWKTWPDLKPTQEPKHTIGILITAQHPALDQVRLGFEGELKTTYGSSIEFIVHNADGLASQAQAMAQQLHRNQKVELIIAIGTLAAQTVANIEKQKPVLIAAVSDPSAAGLNQTNIAGTTDRIDAKLHLEFIRKLLPKAHQFSILYNPGEANSVAQVKGFEAAIIQAHLQVQLIGVGQLSDLPAAVTKACRNAQAILVPADNLLVSAMPLLSKIAQKNGVPVIASDLPSVKQGAFAARSIDYQEAGIQTAQLARQIIDGHKTPSDLGIVDPSGASEAVNTRKHTIGILMTAQHPALEQVRQGFEKEVNQAYGTSVEFVVHNADGLASQAQAMAQQLHRNQTVELILAVGTLAAQTVAHIEKQKPVLIAAVSDPGAIGLHRQDNIAGTTDRIDADLHLVFVRKLLPRAHQFSVLYNPGEANSVAQTKSLEVALINSGLKVKLVGVGQLSDLPAAVTKACKSAHAILVPADNLLASAMPLLTRMAHQRKVPVITSDVMLVHQGALGGRSVDYFSAGGQIGQLARQIIDHDKTPKELGIIDPKGATEAINTQVLKELGL